MKKMKKLVPLLVAGLLAASMSVGKAQTYPDRPIKMIVSIAAGSVTDVIMRTAAAELQQRLGKPIVIENLWRRRRHHRRPDLRAGQARRLHHLRHLSLDDVLQPAPVQQPAL